MLSMRVRILEDRQAWSSPCFVLIIRTSVESDETSRTCLLLRLCAVTEYKLDLS